MVEEPIIINYKEAQLQLCLRNIARFVFGELQYSQHLHDQVEFVINNANKQTGELIYSLAKAKGLLD